MQMKKEEMRWSEKGFTILEVLLGVSIFAIGLLGVTYLLISMINSTSFSGRLSEAGTLAANQLERLMRTSYGTGILVDTDTDGLGGLHHTGVNADHSLLNQGKNNGMDIYWNNAPNEPVAGSTTVGIMVIWQEKGVERNLKIAGVRINEIE